MSWLIQLSTILNDRAKYLKEVKNARPMQTTLIHITDGKTYVY
jgi:hypothetical protein